MAPRGSYQSHRHEAVEEIFTSNPDTCMDVEEVHQALLAKGQEMGLTTVYRALTRLCEKGVLRRYISDEHEAARYQFNSCTQEHLHIRCVQCGSLEHLHCDEVEGFRRHLLKHHGFDLCESKTMLYGLCKACKAEETHEK